MFVLSVWLHQSEQTLQLTATESPGNLLMTPVTFYVVKHYVALFFCFGSLPSVMSL